MNLAATILSAGYKKQTGAKLKSCNFIANYLTDELTMEFNGNVKKSKVSEVNEVDLIFKQIESKLNFDKKNSTIEIINLKMDYENKIQEVNLFYKDKDGNKLKTGYTAKI